MTCACGHPDADHEEGPDVTACGRCGCVRFTRRPTRLVIAHGDLIRVHFVADPTTRKRGAPREADGALRAPVAGEIESISVNGVRVFP